MIQARLYDQMLSEHLANYRQMAWISGPRQIGKTTTCRALASIYFNWDNSDPRRLILRGPAAIAEAMGLDQLRDRPGAWAISHSCRNFVSASRTDCSFALIQCRS